MMILSRLWYVILALVLGAAYYVVSLSVGQYNRRNRAAMEEMLKADSQAVNWGLQVDARRRLDVLFLAAVDTNLAKSLRTASGKDPVPTTSREEAAKALRAFNYKLPAEYRSDVLLLADREGRLVAQIGYEASSSFPQFELGGYPAVFDALHGYLRDDTWVWGGKIARVVARPVEDEVGQPPLGAVVALRWVDASFAREMSKRTRTSVVFFASGQRVASAAVEGFDESLLEGLSSEITSATEDPSFKENGRTEARPLGPAGDEKGALVFARLPGDAWELGAGFAVARPKIAMSSPRDVLSGADDTDKRNVKLGLVALIVLVAALVGLGCSFVEHTRPLRELRAQALELKEGRSDRLNLPRFSGGLRAIANDLNVGIQRVVEQGGGKANKPADLASILGPAPAQPNLSAFTLPERDTPPAVPPPVPKPKSPEVAPAPAPTPVPARPPIPAPIDIRPDDEITKVTRPPADLLNASGEAAREPLEEWRKLFEQYRETKLACGEPTEGLTFDKFCQTLKKTRDALVAQHGSKRVVFSVYVKEGRASVKASPTRD